MSYRVLAIWTAWMLVACSASPAADDILHHEDLKQIDEGQGDTVEVQFAPDVAEVKPPEDMVLEIHDFAQPDLQEPACDPDEGCFLDKCAENIDCQSGWCVEHMGEGVCTTLCTEECPQGWGCKQVGSGPDLVYVCVSNYANLCKPCNATADCKAIGGVDDLCIDYGDEGAFCGGACLSSDDCPWGFACQEATTVDGIGASQCVNEAGVCPCTSKSVFLSLWSACDTTNEHGICGGKRTCTEDGLSECDAQVPMAEICNGLDENCDEDVDEPALVDGDFVNLCDDGNLCTEGDQCSNGWCVAGESIDCGDDNPCTDDSCDPEVGCVVTMNEAVCADNDVCSTGDHCHLGQCIGAGELTCSDSNLCTDDGCDALVGCTFTPNSALCDDGNECTLDDTCQNGWCGASDFNGCNDDNPCTDDSCDPEVGCSNVPNTLPCNDGDECTLDEVCAQSICGGGFPKNCNDNNPCTDDSCHPATGCLNANNSVLCDDGDECTAGDTCTNGFCVGPETVICDDLNQCTEDSCSPATGCDYAPLDAVPCTDNSLCTDGDSCVAGQCIAGPDLACDDLQKCTSDSCDAETGCQYDPIIPCCGNSVVEPPEECDDGNDLSGDGCNSQCLLVTNLQPGDTTSVVEREGFKIQCKQWVGQQCHEVWFRIPPAAVSQMAPCGVDDLDTLRPMWHGSVVEQCKTVCWIATGDPTCLWSQSDVKNGSASGWMYTASGINCDSDGRQQSEVDVPTVGKQVWSFDKFSWQRSGHFSGYQCNW